MSRYQILWDNGHASGTLAGIYTNRRTAEREARAWKRDMVAIDENPREAREAYSWEVIEADDKEGATS